MSSNPTQTRSLPDGAGPSGFACGSPIGHETVTLTAASSPGLIFADDEVFTFGRQAFTRPDDPPESISRQRVGLEAMGVRHSRGIIREIDHEKPRQDILVEIPALAVSYAAKK